MATKVLKLAAKKKNEEAEATGEGFVRPPAAKIIHMRVSVGPQDTNTMSEFATQLREILAGEANQITIVSSEYEYLEDGQVYRSSDWEAWDGNPNKRPPTFPEVLRGVNHDSAFKREAQSRNAQSNASNVGTKNSIPNIGGKGPRAEKNPATRLLGSGPVLRSADGATGPATTGSGTYAPPSNPPNLMTVEETLQAMRKSSGLTPKTGKPTKRLAARKARVTKPATTRKVVQEKIEDVEISTETINAAASAQATSATNKLKLKLRSGK